MPPKKVAFIAMPFGTKETQSLGVSRAPAKIDFDALWNRAYFPALENTGYLPIRADIQDGSLIIKEMISQLMLADLVIADITIPNANVYYEIGLRHGGSNKGCLLFSADWAHPVFDLAQIRRATYPFDSEAPTDPQFEKVRIAIERGLQGLDASDNPVRELIEAEVLAKGESAALKQVRDDVMDLQTRIRACRVETSTQASKQKAKQILADHNPACLPDYAIRDLFLLVRDVLGWQQVLDFHQGLTKEQRKIPELRENVALAMSKVGDTNRAVAEIEALITESGETSERARLIGWFYKQRYFELTDRRKQRLALNAAIKYYEIGLSLDLNKDSCSRNLLVLYLVEGKRGSTEKAADMAAHILRVCEHKERIDAGDHWVEASRLIVAFFAQDLERARELADDVAQHVATGVMANWEVALCIEFLELLVKFIREDVREDFNDIIDGFKSDISIEQPALRNRIGQVLHEMSSDYQKFQFVRARIAVEGERVVSIVDSGRETVNFAGADDYLVENQTGAKERYIVSGEKFRQRYEETEKTEAGWNLYRPLGEIKGIRVDRVILNALDQQGSFFIKAPWGEAQRVDEGDMLVTTLPLCDPPEIYRIARKEFAETYAPKDGVT